ASAGDTILTKGSPSRSLLLVEEGDVEILDEALGESVVLASVGPGGVIGEVGFVDGRPRTHHGRARANCPLRRPTRERVLEIVKDDPELFAKLTLGLAELLAERFRSVVHELEPVRAFAATLKEPMDLEAGQSFDEIEEPLPETAVDLIRDVARKSD